KALNLMSALNPAISHTAIEGGQFPAEVEARGVLSVPTVFLNGELFDTGRMTLAEIVRRLDSTSDADAAAELSARAPYDVLVVGGGPAGATAAIYAARKGIRTAVVAERMGGQVLDTAGIENIPSILHTEGTAFGAALERHCQQYNVDLVTGQTVTNLAAGSATEPVSLTLANGAKLAGRTVILATGARWRDMGVPGEQEYRTKGVTYCPHCDGPLFAGKPVAVIGGGNSGIEAAIDLAGVASQVTVLEFLDQLKADDVLIKKVHSLPNVTVLTSVATTEVIGDGVKVTGLRYRDRTDESVHELELAGIFVQIGLQPNNEWLRGGPVELNQRGEIVVDGRGATNVEAVFAAGDGTTQPYKQIIISCGAGATAALSAFDHLMRTT
ncbi:MAG: alkyl hydroperoxide reductase subunit F, partial [Propionibacteriaceae bacterium]|nr:alkyl hydroperoxide reductase subunit F [Propionibacteriaceae bacterium]